MIMEKMERIKEKGFVEKNEELTRRLAADVTKDVAASDVQKMVKELINLLANSTVQHWIWKKLLEYRDRQLPAQSTDDKRR